MYVHMCVCGTKENVLINLKFWMQLECGSVCVPSFRKSVYLLFAHTLGNKVFYVAENIPGGFLLGHVTISVVHIQISSVKKTDRQTDSEKRSASERTSAINTTTTTTLRILVSMNIQTKYKNAELYEQKCAQNKQENNKAVGFLRPSPLLPLKSLYSKICFTCCWKCNNLF